MVRPGYIAIALLVSACSGEIQSDIYENLDPKDQVALEKWVDKALPVFSSKCVMCHDGSMPDVTPVPPPYLAGASDLEKRDTVLAHMPAVINLSAPQSSRVLTKGAHTGPALDATEASAILSWIVAERDAHADEVVVIRSEKFTLMLCTGGMPGVDPTCPINTVVLDALGVPATLEFVATPLVSDLYLTNIKLKAGAMGLHVVHPMFEAWPPDATEPTPDPIDRWFNVDLNLQPDTEAPIGTGEGTYVGFKGTDALSIRFDVFEAGKPPM